jgi:hypothetical protein
MLERSSARRAHASTRARACHFGKWGVMQRVICADLAISLRLLCFGAWLVRQTDK